jgi:hypothetical protein
MVSELCEGFVDIALYEGLMVEKLCNDLWLQFKVDFGAAHHVYVDAYVFALSSFNCDHFKVRLQHLCM